MDTTAIIESFVIAIRSLPDLHDFEIGYGPVVGRSSEQNLTIIFQSGASFKQIGYVLPDEATTKAVFNGLTKEFRTLLKK